MIALEERARQLRVGYEKDVFRAFLVFSGVLGFFIFLAVSLPWAWRALNAPSPWQDVLPTPRAGPFMGCLENPSVRVYRTHSGWTNLYTLGAGELCAWEPNGDWAHKSLHLVVSWKEGERALTDQREDFLKKNYLGLAVLCPQGPLQNPEPQLVRVIRKGARVCTYGCTLSSPLDCGETRLVTRDSGDVAGYESVLKNLILDGDKGAPLQN